MKIICIGRNYSEHAKELGNAIPSEPVFFIKPDTALLKDNEPFYHPDFSKNIQYEVEVVLKINKVGKNIQEKFATNYYSEIGLGIDFTARDIQNELKNSTFELLILKIVFLFKLIIFISVRLALSCILSSFDMFFQYRYLNRLRSELIHLLIPFLFVRLQEFQKTLKFLEH